MTTHRGLRASVLLLALESAVAFLPLAHIGRIQVRCKSPSPFAASDSGGDDWQGYGNDGTNDLQRLRVECYQEEKGQVIDPWQLSDFLLIEAGAYSSFIEDADAGSEAESPIFGEPGEPLPKVKIWQRSSVAADYPMDAELDDVVDLIQEAFSLDERPVYSVEVIRDRDWVTEVQEGWKPIAIGDSLVVRFPWHTEEDLAGLMTDGRRGLLLEGGAAFGSGEHATTVMCCQWLERHLSEHKGASIMDYGSGSGILGLASLLFGAGRVDGVEIDTMAIDSAYRNARMNGLSMPFYVPVEENEKVVSWAAVPEGGLRSPTGVDLRRQPYDICVANILARPLIELSDILRDLTRPDGGYIILAGLLNEQVDAVLAAYRAKGFDMSHVDSMGDWALLVGRRNG